MRQGIPSAALFDCTNDPGSASGEHVFFNVELYPATLVDHSSLRGVHAGAATTSKGAYKHAKHVHTAAYFTLLWAFILMAMGCGLLRAIEAYRPPYGQSGIYLHLGPNCHTGGSGRMTLSYGQASEPAVNSGLQSDYARRTRSQVWDRVPGAVDGA